MKTRPRTPKFGKLIKNALADAKLNKKVVAADAKIHPTTLYRLIDGVGTSKGNAYAVIGSINRLAGYEAIAVESGLRCAGFSFDPVADSEYIAGTAADETMSRIIETCSRLDVETQRDILAIVEAIAHRRGK